METEEMRNACRILEGTLNRGDRSGDPGLDKRIMVVK
jgi:hypothetical protein